MLDPKIKRLLGFKPEDSDAVVAEWWKKRTSKICRPCWELKYCPYGPLVEEFPAITITRKEALENYEEAIRCLEDGVFCTGERINKKTRAFLKKWVEEFDPDDYPETISKDAREMECKVYGHICPVASVAEPFSEAPERRRSGRSIPNPIVLRVVRRDNSTCQICGKHLRDEEIELDHKIPLSKGGSSEEANLRVTCKQCNRQKSNRID